MRLIQCVIILSCEACDVADIYDVGLLMRVEIHNSDHIYSVSADSFLGETVFPIRSELS